MKRLSVSSSRTRPLATAFGLCLLPLLAACGGGGSAPHAITGAVTGLNSGTTVTLLDNGGDALTVSANGAFRFATMLGGGAGYAVTVGRQPVKQTCSVTNGSGTVAQSDVTNVQVNCTADVAYAYLLVKATASSWGVRAYAINPGTGALVPVASAPYATGSNPVKVVTTFDGKFAYVANSAAQSVTEYGIDSATGALQPLTPASVPTLAYVLGLATTFDGRFLYAASNSALTSTGVSSFLSVYGINRQSGVLTRNSSADISIAPKVTAIAVDPAAPLLYELAVPSVGSGPSQLYGYKIDTVTGQVTEIGTTALATLGSLAQGMSIDPTGRLLSVSVNTGFINVYRINPVDGSLAAVPGNPFASGGFTTSAVFNSTATFAYSLNQANSDIFAYSVDPTSGTLTRLPSPSASVPAGAGVQAAAIDPSGSYFYAVNNGSNTVSAYRIDSAGALTPLATVPVASQPRDIAIGQP